MADTNDDGYTTIDQLDPAGTLNGSEAIHGIQNEVDVKITPQQIKDFLGSSVAVVDATCNTAAATANKVVTIAGYTLNPKDILAITFTYGNSYGDSTAVSKTFPNLVVNGTTLKVCDSRGNSAGKGCWNAGDRIEFRVNTAKTEVYIMSHDVRQSSDGVTITSDGSSYYNKQSVDNKVKAINDVQVTIEDSEFLFIVNYNAFRMGNIVSIDLSLRLLTSFAPTSVYKKIATLNKKPNTTYNFCVPCGASSQILFGKIDTNGEISISNYTDTIGTNNTICINLTYMMSN